MTSEATLQERILKARTIQGMTQDALAKALHKDPSQVSKWGRGHHKPLPGTLRQVAEILKVSMLWLAYGEGPMVAPVPAEKGRTPEAGN